MVFMKFSIEVQGLTKEFDGLVAVDHISFKVKSGEIFGLLGPNGAGKTTTIHMLTTLLKPTSGTAKVAGFDIIDQKSEVRKSIGVVFQEPALDNRLTGRENLEFHAMMYGIKKEDRERRIKEVLELVELSDKANVLVKNYSGGMKRRLEIARGLINRPKVLFLDEPTLGLDAQTRRHIWEYVTELRKRTGVTILITTHYMEEADYLCDRVAIIDHGKIIALDTPKKLKDLIGGDVISLNVDNPSRSLINSLEKCEFVKGLRVHNRTIHITVEKGENKIPKIFELARRKRVKIRYVSLRKPSLEDVFLHFTGRTIRESDETQPRRFFMQMRAHV